MKPKLLTVAMAPHRHSGRTVATLIQLTFVGLLPVLIASLYLYRGRAALMLVVGLVFAVATEAILSLILRKPIKVLNGHSALMGVLLALLMPAGAAWWVLAIGASLSVALGKMVFGNAWNYPFHPVLVALVLIQMSWPGDMENHYKPLPILAEEAAAAQSTEGTNGKWEAATDPVAAVKAIPVLSQRANVKELLWGDHPGPIGTTSIIAIALGGLFLIFMRVIPWQIPLGFLGSAWIFATVFARLDPTAYPTPEFSLFAGSLFFVAVFLATEWVTTPVTGWGKLLFGIGAGVMTLIIRYWGQSVEGAIYAVLIMNAVAPLLDRLAPAPFGRRLKVNA